VKSKIGKLKIENLEIYQGCRGWLGDFQIIDARLLILDFPCKK